MPLLPFRWSRLATMSLALLIMPTAFAEGGGEKSSDKSSGPGFYSMPPVVVNLAGQDINHYLQVSIVFQTSQPGVVEKLKEYEPILRSRAILVLSSKHRKDVDTLKGRQMLTDELVDMARVTVPADDKDKAPDNGIKEALLTAFVIQ